jgi:hypothetical protein
MAMYGLFNKHGPAWSVVIVWTLKKAECTRSCFGIHALQPQGMLGRRVCQCHFASAAAFMVELGNGTDAGGL